MCACAASDRWWSSLDGVAFLLHSDFLGDPAATYAVADSIAQSDDEAVAPELKAFLRGHWSEEVSLSFFLHVRRNELYLRLPAFLFGESMGGAATMLMYFQSPPDTWTGLIFSAPLFVIPENMKPSKVHLFLCIKSFTDQKMSFHHQIGYCPS